MSEIRDWKSMRVRSSRLLVERTGESVETWNERIITHNFKVEGALRKWLKERGVEGYAQTLLVMERFGYPEYLLASADELVDGQNSDRPHLRPILEAILKVASGLGEVTIQARKTYISLLTPRRTFARVQPTTKSRVDLAMRLEGTETEGRLAPSRIHETTPVHIELFSAKEVDEEVAEWLENAYKQNL